MWERHKLLFATAGCALFLGIGAGAGAMGATPSVAVSLYVLAYIFGGTFSLIEAMETLVERRRIDADLLMVLAAVAAAAIGEWLEGGILLFLFSLSNAMQAYALDRTRRAITALMSLRPQEALLLQSDGETRVVSIDDLKVNDTIVVRPGELIPIDGIVLAGSSFLDESSITGESIPVEKGPGDKVYGGTLNQHGSLEVRVTQLAEDTVIAKIIRMVEEAQSAEAPTQRAIDTIEQYYAVGVMLLTVAAATIPLALGHDWSETAYRAITLMVVASPCALAMAAPAPIVAAIANGARSGVLFKGGIHIENMSNIDVIAFDKTGTLTEGTPRVTDVVPVGDWAPEQIVSAAAAVERRSEHPLAHAILEEAERLGVRYPEAEEAEARPGQGIVATVDGKTTWIGNLRLATHRIGLIPEPILERLRSLEAEGKTVMLIGTDRLQGLIAVIDALRPGAPEAMRALKDAGIRRVVILTGDNERVAAAVARQIGIDEYHAGLLPHEKAERIDALKKQYGRLAMVGDGVNDAPALATATVGVAMGTRGSDIALETADVVLMSNDLSKLVHALKLSRRTRVILWQNVVFALSVIAGLIVAVLATGIVLAVGVIGHEGSTILVIMNSLRLLLGQHRSKGEWAHKEAVAS